MISNMMKTNQNFRNLISILLGFGLASLFRKSCNNNNCLVIKGPDFNEIKTKVFKVDEKCYSYTPKPSQCENVEP